MAGRPEIPSTSEPERVTIMGLSLRTAALAGILAIGVLAIGSAPANAQGYGGYYGQGYGGSYGGGGYGGGYGELYLGFGGFGSDVLGI